MRFLGKARAKIAALSGGSAVLLAGCARTNIPQDTFNPAGPDARQEAHLYWGVFVVAVLVFVLVEGLIVFRSAKYRSRAGRPEPVQIHGSKRLERTWTIIPAVMLAVVAGFTIPVIFSLAAKPAGSYLQVDVIGHQWWWEVTYPGRNITTANEIHIPAGQPVYVTITSKDVIHSFWVPRLAGKQDLEPGRTNHLKIQADHPGTYEGQCAEFCGESHANMRFKVIADSQPDFQAWLADESSPAARPPAGLAAGLDSSASHAWKSGWLSAITLNRMLAWDSPQNSAHCPSYVPGRSAWIFRWLVLPGSRSCFPASLGTQKLWMTSFDVIATNTGCPTGMWISLAVVMFFPGYVTSHHH
jgi:cytochrome c oxidase subunit II